MIEEFIPTWSLAPVIRALQTLRGVDLIVAVTFATEVGDVTRFESPRQLMGYLGLVPGERSTGETVRRGAITKAGNGRVRHMLVESAWTYRHPPTVGAKKLYRLEAAPPKVREIAWKAQSRLTARYRLLAGRGKRTTVVCTAMGGCKGAVVPSPPMREVQVCCGDLRSDRLRYPTRASELDHRRPSVPPPPIRDHSHEAVRGNGPFPAPKSLTTDIRAVF